MTFRHFIYSISHIYILQNNIVCLYSIVETFVFLILRSTNTFTLCMQRVNLNPTPLLIFLFTSPPNKDMFTYFWVASIAADFFVLVLFQRFCGNCHECVNKMNNSTNTNNFEIDYIEYFVLKSHKFNSRNQLPEYTNLNIYGWYRSYNLKNKINSMKLWNH